MPVSNLIRSVSFYRDTLGFFLIGYDEQPNMQQAFVCVKPGAFTLELIQWRDQVKRATATGRPDHLAFECRAIEGIHARLAAHPEMTAGKSPALPELQVFPSGLKHLSLYDPDGLKLDFFEGRQIYDEWLSKKDESSLD
jgi:hypothetical protein